MPRNCRYDYGGPNVSWPGDTIDPDWAALFPIPASKRAEDRPSKRSRRADDSSDDEDDFWLIPRMACRLHNAGCWYVDTYCIEDSAGVVDEMPAVVQPYAQRKPWMDAYTQAAMRLVRRLEKGLEPQPNCTAEEFALHKVIGMAEAFCADNFGGIEEELEPLPRSTLDEDFHLVSDAAFQDHDVLMLFDMPQLIHPSGMTQMMDLANLHPEDWLQPFKPDRTRNHV